MRAEFIRTGQTIKGWARDNGFPPTLVHNVLAGRPCRRGKSHAIAVLLKLKDGEIVDSAQAA